MDTIQVKTSSKRYSVFIGEKILDQLVTFIQQNFSSTSKVLLISDETVGKIHLPAVEDVLSTLPVVTYTVPTGEKCKTFQVYEEVLTYALQQKLDRRSIIIAFGGGAVGDLSGFVAATYMRGIPFIQLPTTILAHDSAVGGKTALNHPLGKNMVGAFYQPEAVFYDLQFLKTLPAREIRSGFAEVIKHSLIADSSFFNELIDNIKNLEQLSGTLLANSLKRGIEIKASIVAKDEKEENVRAYLNFGHTLGHAIESEVGYGRISHGEAVVIGMVFAINISAKLNQLSFDCDRFKQWLTSLGYDVHIPDSLVPERLLEKMKQDKKSVQQKVRFVLLNKIGQPTIVEVDDALLLDSIRKLK